VAGAVHARRLVQFARRRSSSTASRR